MSDGNNGTGSVTARDKAAQGQFMTYRQMFEAPSDEELMSLASLHDNVHWRRVLNWLQRARLVNNETLAHHWSNREMGVFLSGASISLKTLLSYTDNPGNELLARQKARQEQASLIEAGRAQMEIDS